MDRGRKRSDDADAEEGEITTKNKKTKSDSDDVVTELGYALPPLGMFEFPWLDATSEWDVDLHDVFFSSLVVSPSIAIFLPEDPPEEAEETELHGVWSSLLREPLSAAVYGKNPD